MVEEVQKHSVHTLVFRSLKRTHDMFVADNGKPVPLDEESHKRKMAIKLRNEYGPVLHMPTSKRILRRRDLKTHQIHILISSILPIKDKMLNIW